MEQPPSSVDVLIIGGGPVGLLLAYQLAKGGCSVHIIDKEDKSSVTQYGRANALYSRSTEFLDQLGLADDLLQQSYICRESYTYDKDGQRVIPGRVWNFVENIDDTVFDFAIMLRQQYIEQCFRARLADMGVTLHCPVECTGFQTLESSTDKHPVTATLKNLKTNEQYTVKSGYLVGADGGRSFVRRHMNVQFEGDTTQDKWIRVDGKVKSNLPTPKAYGSIESPTHGNILWAPLDRGFTRIGYVYTEEQERKCGGNLTQEAVVKEAIEAMKPFEVEFESVEWWTLYVIGQRVASSYQPHSRIILVGDACHTHSSGAAQGLNTGIHDAINLGWKLSMVVKGVAKESLLSTYSSERRAAAQRLIAFDRKISTLMANKWPEGMPSDGDINQVLANTFDEASGYNTGLKLEYEYNLINVASDSGPGNCSIRPGMRAPDARLLKPVTAEPIRLQSVTPNKGALYVAAFAGDPRMTLPGLQSFATYLSSSKSFQARYSAAAVQTIAIVSANPQLSGIDALAISPFGKVYIDHKRQAHARYGVDLRYGSLVVLRPDGIVGFTAPLSSVGGEAVEGYLSHFLVGVDE